MHRSVTLRVRGLPLTSGNAGVGLTRPVFGGTIDLNAGNNRQNQQKGGDRREACKNEPFEALDRFRDLPGDFGGVSASQHSITKTQSESNSFTVKVGKANNKAEEKDAARRVTSARGAYLRGTFTSRCSSKGRCRAPGRCRNLERTKAERG